MSKKSRRILLDGLFRNNPILVQVLGICSTLAVTNVLKNTVVMCVALVYVLVVSGVIVSLIRAWIPPRVRMMAEILVIATSVILVDIALKAWLPEMSRQLGAYVGLIITNCIVMGRSEAFAMSNPPHLAALDGLASGLGYSLILILIAVIREPLGFGTLWGVPVMGAGWTNWSIMVMAPGAFFVLAGIVWAVKALFPGTSNECGCAS
jgi:Na+-transporting NADH:ubiquinone oxidoreductase subunit D